MAPLRWKAIVLLALFSASSPASVSAQALSDFPIPTPNSLPGGIVTGPDGALWFNEIAGHKIGRITTGGAITEFTIRPLGSYFSHNYPGGIAAGPDGALWFADDFKIGRITTAGAITEFPVSGGSTPLSIVPGPDGALWFTEIDGLIGNDIGRITATGVITHFTVSAGDFYAGIASGPDGALWFTEFYRNRIGRITTSGVVTEFPAPTPDSQPFGIVAGPDGALWFTEFGGNKIGRITTAGVFTEFPLPPSTRHPSHIVAGADGALWFAGDHRIGRITTAGAITEFAVTGLYGGLDRIAWGPDGALWFTLANSNRIGRLALAPGTCTPDATTLCLNNGRFQVRSQWTTRDGSSGSGQAVAVTADAGYFTFFDPSNVEIVVKVVNGCGVNSRYWTFAAGLTDVDVTLAVTDSRTGALQTYSNEQGVAFQSIQDTSAFAACP